MRRLHERCVFQELGQMEQQNRELRALSTRWQVRAEASERGCREAGEALEEERSKRLEVGSYGLWCKQSNGEGTESGTGRPACVSISYHRFSEIFNE